MQKHFSLLPQKLLSNHLFFSGYDKMVTQNSSPESMTVFLSFQSEILLVIYGTINIYQLLFC